MQAFQSIPKNRGLLLFLLAFVEFTHIMDFMIVMPLGDIFMTLFDITPKKFGIIVSSYTFSAFFSSLIGAFFIDRFDRKKALIGVYLGFVLGNVMCGLSDSYLTLVAARLFTGFFGGIIGALLLSIISDLYPIEKRGQAMGILTAAFSVAAVLGVPLGLYLAHEYSWNVTFYLLGAMGILAAILLWTQMPAMTGHFRKSPEGPDGESPRHPSSVKIFLELLTERNSLLALSLSAIIVLGQFIVIPFIAPYMTRNAGMTQDQIIWLYGVGGACTIIAAPFIGFLTDRFGIKRTFLVLMVLANIPTLVLTHLTEIPFWQGLIVAAVFFIFVSGRIIPGQTLMTAAVPSGKRGSFMSLKSALQQLSSAAAAYLGGVILIEADNGQFMHFNWLGWISVGGSIIAVFLAWPIRQVQDH